MAKLNRKTTAILCAAGSLVAAAVILGNRAGQASTTPTDVPTPPAPIPSPVPIADACGLVAPATAKAIAPVGTLSAGLSSAKLVRNGGGEAYVAFDLEARDAVKEHRPPLDIAIVLDRSGSMTGEPIERARSAARGVVERLTPRDRVAVVQFDTTADVLVSLTHVEGAGRERLLRAIDGIEEGDKTNIHDGLVAGREELFKNPGEGRLARVILMSDGNATAGVRDMNEIARVAGIAAERGIRVTAMGLGAHYNEDLMEEVADRGRGQYYFVREASELHAVFTGELEALQATVATKAELRLEPSCAGVEIAEVFGYPTRRDGNATIVELSDLSGGERRKIVARLRVPDAKVGPVGILSATFAYVDPAGGKAVPATVALGAEITEDYADAEKSANKDVIVKVTQVESGVVMREAAAAYAAGDRARAQGLLSVQKRKVEEKARKYELPAAAVAPAAAPLDDYRKEMDLHDPFSGGGATTTKGSKKKGRELMH